MLLDVDEAVFRSDEHEAVFSLLSMVVKGRHDWVLTPEAVFAAEDFVTKITPKTVRYRELLDAAAVAMVYPDPRTPNVRVTVGELLDLVEDLGQAAVVLVENSKNDGSFVRALIATLGTPELVTALTNYWLTIEHAGGSGDMDGRARELCGRFRKLRRVVVLIDSDRDSPGEITKNHEKRDILLKDTNVHAAHVWEWREVENYVPRAAWKKHFTNRDAKLDTLVAMIPRQRGYLDVKNGGWNDPSIRAGVSSDALKWWDKHGLKVRSGSTLVPPGTTLTREDFEEAGPEAMAEFERLLALIDEIR